MNATDQQVSKRLLEILHMGFVEVRSLALAAGDQQIADLADAMEVIPARLNEFTDDDLELFRYALKAYQDKYHSSYDYPRRLG